MKGWVYVLSNKGHPELVKVGFSTKDPKERAKELGGTGQPYPFVVDYEVHVDEPHPIEQAAHKRLKQFRENKEFFRCTPEVAVGAIRNIVGTKAYYEKFHRADRQKIEEAARRREEELASELRKATAEAEKKREADERKSRRNEELTLRRIDIEVRYESLIRESESQEKPSTAKILLYITFICWGFGIAVIIGGWAVVIYYLIVTIFGVTKVKDVRQARARKKATREALIKERDAKLEAIKIETAELQTITDGFACPGCRKFMNYSSLRTGVDGLRKCPFCNMNF